MVLACFESVTWKFNTNKSIFCSHFYVSCSINYGKRRKWLLVYSTIYGRWSLCGPRLHRSRPFGEFSSLGRKRFCSRQKLSLIYRVCIHVNMLTSFIRVAVHNYYYLILPYCYFYALFTTSQRQCAYSTQKLKENRCEKTIWELGNIIRLPEN